VILGGQTGTGTVGAKVLGGVWITSEVQPGGIEMGTGQQVRVVRQGGICRGVCKPCGHFQDFGCFSDLSSWEKLLKGSELRDSIHLHFYNEASENTIWVGGRSL
jgi:hypothetical protein